jgi:chromosome partitioning protein
VINSYQLAIGLLPDSSRLFCRYLTSTSSAAASPAILQGVRLLENSLPVATRYHPGLLTHITQKDVSSMQVIVFASSKGGVGKTTSALALASVLTHHGAPTTLIDADPNAPLALWSSRFPDGVPAALTVKTAFRTDVAEVIDAASDPYVIVDLEGSRNDEVSVAIGRADLVLIPMKGNQLDADEAVNVIKVIRKQETIFRRKIPFRVFLSQTSPVIMDKGMRDICDQMRENSIPMLRQAIVERSAFKAPFRLGGTIYELTGREANNPDAAIANAEAFAQEVRDILIGAPTGIEVLHAG